MPDADHHRVRHFACALGPISASPRGDNALPKGMSIGAVNLRLSTHEFHDTANSFAIIDADHTATPYFSQATHCTRGSKPTRHYDGIRRLKATTVIVTRRFGSHPQCRVLLAKSMAIDTG